MTPPRLSNLTAGRDNNFLLLRILAAIAVVVFHSFALTQPGTDDPLARLVPGLDLGGLGVQAFFFISGLLVTRSWVERGRLRPFVAARVLRIYPALIVATLFTIALAAWSSPLALPAFLAHPQTLDYAWHTALAWAPRDTLPGAYAANPYPHAVNGSLWTLPVELRCYVGVAIAGIVGLCTRRIALGITVIVLFLVFALVPGSFPMTPDAKATREVTWLFALGALAYAWRAAIPLSLAGAFLALVAIVATEGTLRSLLHPLLLGYALLVAAYHPRLRWPAFNRLGDYSYGTYVYAFPIQQTLARLLPGIGPWEMLAGALPLTLAAAALSWHLLEKPALAVKSRLRPPAPEGT